MPTKTILNLRAVSGADNDRPVHDEDHLDREATKWIEQLDREAAAYDLVTLVLECECGAVVADRGAIHIFSDDPDRLSNLREAIRRCGDPLGFIGVGDDKNGRTCASAWVADASSDNPDPMVDFPDLIDHIPKIIQDYVCGERHVGLGSDLD